MKLTHCDLFFADAAILVEGNVERLLLPVMIEQAAGSLRSSSLSILEVGGAFGHRFETLIRFLGLTALVITDLDSVTASTAAADEDVTEFEIPRTGADDPPVSRSGKTCLPSIAGAVTSNQTLIRWLPRKQTVAELLNATAGSKVEGGTDVDEHHVRVAYQVPTAVIWNEATATLCGRTLEEAFGLENAAWCQDPARRHVGLHLRIAPTSPAELASALHARVSGRSFDKTRFALAVLTEPPSGWTVPLYIREGLEWLAAQVGLETALDKSVPGPAGPPSDVTAA